MPDINAMIDAFNSPATRHAMLVHLPIVLAMIGCAFALLAAVLRGNKTLIALAIACQALLVGAAFVTTNSGEQAEHAIAIRLPDVVNQLVQQHEDMAGKVWLFGAGVFVLLVVSAAMRNAVGAICAWVAVLGSAGTIAWVSGTAHLGGELVYQHGVGTPLTRAASPSTSMPASRPSAAPDRAASAPAKPDTETATPADPVDVAFFREQVYPILSNNCFNCHNETRAAAGKSASLDQTSRETMLKGGRSGPAIVPGKPEESLLLGRLRGEIPDKSVMPPRGKLPDESIAIIEQWIRDGAVWAEPTP
jgi:uncharacterized membrane protein